MMRAVHWPPAERACVTLRMLSRRLAWLFLISRIVVASAFLNAALWRRSRGTE
jgi:hypothetical protein